MQKIRRNYISKNIDIATTRRGNKYYVDFTGGNDSNEGRTEKYPWKTIAKVNAFVFSPGSMVLFKRGETWTGTTLNVDAYVVYADYGVGALPIIETIVAAQNSVYSNLEYGFTIRNIRFISVAGYAVYIGGWHGGGAGDGVYYATLDGLEISGGVYVLGAYNTVQNCTIDGTLNDGIYGKGILDSSVASHHNQYLNNTIHDFSLWGIHSLILTHDNTYTGNTIYNIGYATGWGQGIDFDGAGTAAWRHTAENNTIYHCGYGINSENGYDCIIQNNKISDCTYTLIQCVNYGPPINGTVGGEFGEYGANGDVRGLDTNLIIRQNLLYSGLNGIINFDCGNVQIYANTIYGSGLRGVRFSSTYCIDNELVSNIIMNSGVSAFTGNICLPDATYTLTGFIDNNNVVFSNIAKPHYEEYNIGSKTLAQYQILTGLGANSVALDPLFVNPAIANFHLQAGSPAINIGVANGLPTDLDGVTRGTPPDIGVYEYV